MSNSVQIHSKRRKNIFIMGILVPITIIAALLVGSIFATIHFNKIKKSATKTTATISKIETVITEDSERVKNSRQEEYSTIEHVVYINYIVNEIEYKNIKLNYYNASMQIGDEVDIYCDSQNPSKIISVTNFGFIFLAIVAVASVIYFIILPTKILKESRRRKHLLSNGECHRVAISSIEYNYMESADTRDKVRKIKIGKYLLAKYNGQTFTSEEINLKDEVEVGYTIDLYLDREQLSKSRNSQINKFRGKTAKGCNYYLDINSVKKESL